MALLKLGGLVTEISGRIGGNILATSPNGSYIKSNAYSQQHPSQAQSLQRTQLYITTQLWRSLSPTQQASFASRVGQYTYINRVGDTVTPTAYQLFAKINANALQLGQSFITTCPDQTSYTTSNITELIVSDGEFTVNMDPDANGDYYGVFASPFSDFHKAFNYKQLRYLGYFIGTGSGSGYDFYTEYTNIFGPLYNYKYYDVLVKQYHPDNCYPNPVILTDTVFSG